MDVNRDEYLQECFRVDHECWPTGTMGTRCCDTGPRDHHKATRPSRGESRGNDRAKQIHSCSSLYHTADNSGCVILTRLRLFQLTVTYISTSTKKI